MLPTTSSNLTYDDVFRLLRERHMPNTGAATKAPQGQENKAPESSKDDKDANKEGQTENQSAPSLDPNIAQQMQLLLMLRLLGKLPLDTSGATSNTSNKQNLGVSLGQNENEPQKKSSSKTKMPLQSSLAINVDQKKAGKGGDLSSIVKSKSDKKLSELDIQNEDPNLSEIDPKSKKIRKMNMCGHPERAHYAKNMCNQCYHKHGRTKKPWRCNHERLYAHGLCQNCYINAYNKKRSLKSKEDEPSATPSMELEGEGVTASISSPRSLPSGASKEEDGSSSIQAENEGNIDDIEGSEKKEDKEEPEKVEVEEPKDEIKEAENTENENKEEVNEEKK